MEFVLGQVTGVKGENGQLSALTIRRENGETYDHPCDDMMPFYEDENCAIHRRDPEAARAACVGRSYLMAQNMLAELCRRRVFIADESVAAVPETHEQPSVLL